MHKKFIPKVIRDPHRNSITIEPSQGKIKSTLIWLHGLCDSSQGFYSYFTHSHSPLYHNSMRIKLLQAPLRRITINSNQKCHAWYNIHSLDRFKKNQEEEKQVFDFTDIRESLDYIKQEIDQAAQQLYKQQKDSKINPYHKIYLGGFSQGGVIALNHSLRTQNVIGGAICFSGYALQSFQYRNIKKMPILLAHGSSDETVPQLQALKSYEELLKDRSLVFYQSFQNLNHSVCLEQLDLLSTWTNDMQTMRNKIYQNIKTQ